MKVLCVGGPANGEVRDVPYTDPLSWTGSWATFRVEGEQVPGQDSLFPRLAPVETVTYTVMRYKVGHRLLALAVPVDLDADQVDSLLPEVLLNQKALAVMV